MGEGTEIGYVLSVPEDFEDLPSTLQRSPESARTTFAAAKEGAEESYGTGERARRTAYATLKRTHEKVGDHWEPKEEKGPSDSRARSGGPNPSGETAGGVDANADKDHLYRRAQQLGVSGRSDMTKDELVDAVQEENDRRTRQARGDENQDSTPIGERSSTGRRGDA